MKLSVTWLREYVQTPLSNEELADALTMAGLEVEETTSSSDGPVFHTKVTPNRGDWMSVLGHAREAAAALDVPLLYAPPSLPQETPDVLRWAGVRIEDPALCSRYCAKIIRNVQPHSSPAWMQEKLLAAGMRPINAIVDVTNFVMLEMGQPLHAFDYDTLPEGQIIVRRARENETLTTLDGVERHLSPETLLICTPEGPVAVAGVMGGQRAEVSSTTRTVFLESAHFNPQSVRRTSKLLGLSTEASYRYERFVDPQLCPLALERAAELLAEYADGEIIAGRIDLNPVPTLPLTIEMRPTRCNALLGTTLSPETIAQCLQRLQFTVETDRDTLRVTVPTFRPDVTAEIDCVEEVGRIWGYQNLPETLPPSPIGSPNGQENPPALFAARLRSTLSGMGLQEALTNSLVPPSPLSATEDAARVDIRQALSAELSTLRTSLLPNLLDALTRNLRRRSLDVALFETGKVFRKGAGDGVYDEPRRVSGVLTGQFDGAAVNFFTAKGIVETLARSLHLPPLRFSPASFRTPTETFLTPSAAFPTPSETFPTPTETFPTPTETFPSYHPGRSCEVFCQHERVGFIGEVDPDVLTRTLDAPAGTGRVCVFEMDADTLLSLSRKQPQHVPLPRFADAFRDLAVIVSAETPYALLESVAVQTAAPDLLRGVSLVSIYREPPIPAGRKSVALRFTFRADDRTLTDGEMDTQVNAVRLAFVRELGAVER